MENSLPSDWVLLSREYRAQPQGHSFATASDPTSMFRMAILIAALANLLTLLRLLLGLAFPWIPHGWRVAAVVFGALSDFADGVWSRFWKSTTNIGRILDPIADKVFVVSVLCTFLAEDRIRPWQLAVLMVREVVVVVGAMWVVWARQPNLSQIRARPTGKIATAGQLIFLVSLLLLPEMNLVVFWATAILTAVAAVDYASAFFRGAGRTPAT